MVIKKTSYREKALLNFDSLVDTLFCFPWGVFKIMSLQKFVSRLAFKKKFDLPSFVIVIDCLGKYHQAQDSVLTIYIMQFAYKKNYSNLDQISSSSQFHMILKYLKHTGTLN